ncbi:MAG: alpha/beta hydrolase [Bacteroidales bacterium]
MKKILAILSVSFLIMPSGGKTVPDIYKNLDHIHIAKEVPEDAVHKILVVSNRYFDVEDDYTYARYVHPARKMFWFVVSMTSDSSYITSCSSLEEAMQFFPADRNFLVFVNGHGKNFGQVIGRGFEVGLRYDVNMIMFDWPTEYYALRKTAQNARKVTKNFALTIRDLQPIIRNDYPNSNVSVIFHSMGNHIARRLVKKEFTRFISQGFFDNLILNAPAVKQKNHARWVDQLTIQKRIYIVTNKDDRPLKGAMVLRLAKQLGSEYEEPLAENAFYVNFSHVAGKEHNIFLGRSAPEKENPNIMSFYKMLFQGSEPKLNDSQAFIAGKYKIDFFIQ